ncbi:hypothetical protein AKJ09_06755 [Labilithrix luteola]|uniref:Uncharacterized protein n=1 Tax=Labilithrix luteola TaxID=1391654 RepID=A0A0K1Q381_9BACT|nr:hypothetical protein AKJ09_06755 [Labilithrix luteola]
MIAPFKGGTTRQQATRTSRVASPLPPEREGTGRAGRGNE